MIPSSPAGDSASTSVTQMPSGSSGDTSSGKFAVGTIFLRGAGSGSVKTVAGVETVEATLNGVIVEARWPKIGVRKSATYTGDGFVTVRHPDINVVENALDFIDRTIRITYSSSQPVETGWNERMYNFKELNRPAWDFEVVK